ncbi:RNA 2'-phosphotransferase [Tengunoibacter tsumagoiensis]|uniref:Probable RNA 2'-phosphotransferase n=1 Tax=Tengunoibacter tsumagoiensis TaxID=2014871 RepID=A0A401ZWY0_9CHLR|nr:RNA 2'-phosphotransferase [Tengunoibacter tsumagoiensis]GCE11322.1 putative RNA 2'-phosphotransferase [Tengunoibacter tsumagoiensis]
MAIDLKSLSKTMAYALRHQPVQFGLTLDEEGWVEVSTLLEALRKQRSAWRLLQTTDLERVIAESDKKRYEIREGRIRAYYGHSIEQKMQHEPVEPPVILYHGTTPEAAPSIRRQGLKPMQRQYVHLATDIETARQVALRRTHKPVIIRVEAQQAYRQGIAFYSGNDDIWLAEPISVDFLHFD